MSAELHSTSPCKAFNLLWTASRGAENVDLAWRQLDGILAKYGAVHLVHGDYKRRDGRLVSDAIADAWARRRAAEGHPVTVEPIAAPWDLLGKSAGGYRNGFMVGLLVGRGADPVGVLAHIVGDSAGASGTAAFAEWAGLPVSRWIP